ncbi:MAG: DMT family transporter [Prevotella sp.]|nr:DMT family transporter [Prevotellaceae bacterium]MDD7074424.1 DMT family transporter [Prevotellaceae bacterium]MDY5209896.1 DMT family transporter [Prevotella sp.]MDY5343765.1 DMT family transporter [Prevotella sp.]
MAHKYHIVAFLTVAVWGTTFVWTKLLIINGLSPAQIFTLRFIIAYVLLTGFSLWLGRHKWLSDNWRDELTMMALGLTGGSMYFLTENESLRFTTATNTSLIVCSCPLFAMLIIALFYKSERFSRLQALGSLLALIGMAAVVLNGHFVLHLSPLGDTLAFSACICWALYTLLMKPVMGRYPAMFITRKVFFYGILTILPYYIFLPDMPSLDVLMRPEVALNLLFLGSVASMLCYLTWSWCMKGLGAVICTNWVYVNPITTIIAAWLILDEQITVYFLIGSILIIAGMYLSSKK